MLNNVTYNNYTFSVQLEIGSEATSYTPYKNFENEEIYSTNEIKIGTWINGKPLYRKVVTETPDIATTTQNASFNVNIANADEVFISSMTKIADTSSSGYRFNFPYVSGNINKTIGGYLAVLDANRVQVNIRKGNDIGVYSMRLVIEYTKSTD